MDQDLDHVRRCQQLLEGPRLSLRRLGPSLSDDPGPHQFCELAEEEWVVDLKSPLRRKELPQPRVATLPDLPMQSSSFLHSAMHEEGMG